MLKILEIVKIFFLALMPWILWAYGFSIIHNYICTHILGSCNDRISFWLTLILISFVMGLFPSLIFGFLFKLKSNFYLFIYLIFIILIAALTTGIAGGVESLTVLFTSIGFWSFIFGSIIGAILVNIIISR